MDADRFSPVLRLAKTGEQCKVFVKRLRDDEFFIARAKTFEAAEAALLQQIGGVNGR